MQHHDLLITNATLLANPTDGHMENAAYLAVENGAIVAIGKMADLPERQKADRLTPQATCSCRD